MSASKLIFGDSVKTLKTPENEADVRAIIIDPLLKVLGFTHENIIREQSLKSPFLRTGSKKRKVSLIPDYVLKVNNACAWVLDAKTPGQKTVGSDNVEQVYIYAAHPEIRSNYFALCNGLEFACFRTVDTEKPVLYFRIEDIDLYWDELKKLLSPAGFQAGNKFIYEKIVPLPARKDFKDFDYGDRPLLKEIPIKKQSAKRHFGVHGYFTKQSWNIVNAYIKNFSKEGDTVLDPFGGSGVTAVEALVTNRKTINIDLNPFAVFIVKSLLAPVSLKELSEAYIKTSNEYKKNEPKSDKDIERILKKYWRPKDLPLPKSSDVETVSQLFTEKQTAQLALLKAIIEKQKDRNIRNTLLLMFSGLLTKINLTYHSSSVRGEGAGNASAFQYYRYRIAPNPAFIDVMKYFELRYKKVLAAKKEIEEHCMLNGKSFEETMLDAQIVKGSATSLSFLENESVDYIYTDPPYGKKIPYLDLSVMWNAWLDLEVTETDYELEAIEGGEHQKTKDNYNTLMARSIEEMYRVLKFDRWLSFVFAHKDPEFWHLIIETCEKCGFEYIGAVPQKNGQTSFKKRQNPFTVLSGQLIINFRKVRNPRAVLKANLGMDIGEIVIQTVEGVIAKNDGATLEEINDELIIKGLELGFLDLLKKEYSDLTPLLMQRFDYDRSSEKYSIKKDTRFQTQIDIKLRIRYYLLSFMRRMERENKIPSFDEIVLAILPLLKNGVTPEHQTVLSVLEDIGERVGDDGWKLRVNEKTLFD
ncbi:MAG: type I restriction enzyme HsdR N-terminal domain-containing protein [Prevotellaceae bacterium]|jgi:DNA modification methylase|nr:type I restriction enzyme HsdR N-terminal domain-containing protein [Prevotellaceae bacterium]